MSKTRYETLQVIIHKTPEDRKKKQRLQDVLQNLKHSTGPDARNLDVILLACEYYWCYLNNREWTKTEPRLLIKRNYGETR